MHAYMLSIWETGAGGLWVLGKHGYKAWLCFKNHTYKGQDVRVVGVRVVGVGWGEEWLEIEVEFGSTKL